MIFDPYLNWLGFRPRRPVLGLHVTSTHVIVVAVRRWPLRVVAIARRAVPDAAVVDGDIRLVEPLAASLQLMTERARISPGTPTVAVIEPLTDTISIGLNGPSGPSCDVADRHYQRMVEVITGAGLRVLGIDVVPVALARLGFRVGAPAVALNGPSGWAATLTPDRLHGHRLTSPGGRPTLALGTAVETANAVGDIPGVQLPDALRPLIDPGRDAPAIGAALAAFGQGPRVVARPAEVPVGSGWTVQSALSTYSR